MNARTTTLATAPLYPVAIDCRVASPFGSRFSRPIFLCGANVVVFLAVLVPAGVLLARTERQTHQLALREQPSAQGSEVPRESFGRSELTGETTSSATENALQNLAWAMGLVDVAARTSLSRSGLLLGS